MTAIATVGLEDLGLPPVSWDGLGLGLLALAVAVGVGQLLRLLISAGMRWRGRSAGSARDPLTTSSRTGRPRSTRTSGS